MKKKLHTVAMALGVLCASSFSSFAFAGIPVLVDASIPAEINQVVNHAQAIRNYAQLLRNWTQLRNQYEQQLKMYAAQTGNAMLGNLFSEPALQQYLPSGWQQDMNNVQSQGFSALSQKGQTVVKNLELKQCLMLPKAQQINCQARIGGIVMTQLNTLAAYDKALSREKQIQKLKQAINTTQNPKEIAELNARIVAENGEIKNSATQLLLAQQAQAAQQKLLEAQAEAQANSPWQSQIVGYQTPIINPNNWTL